MTTSRQSDAPATRLLEPGHTLGVIGMGVMGQTLLKGLLDATAISPAQAWGTSRSRATCEKVAAELSVPIQPDISSHLSQTDVVLLCVKPAQAAVALNKLKSTPGLRPDALLISIVAGVHLRELATHLGTDNPWVRAMPNTPCVVGEGMTAIAGGERATASHLARARQVFECVGRCIETDERHFNAITALSGSGPAYQYLIMIRFGGSPYASQTPQIVVTAVQTITAYRTEAVGAAASTRMITSVRIVRPIIDTPSRTPDMTATTRVMAITVGRIAPS